MTNYAYENGTLKNIDGLTDPDKLSAVEAERVAGRLIELRLGGGPQPTFDARHLKALHHHLFQDVYEWAGRTRDERVQLSDGTVATMPTMQKIDGKQFAIGPAISSALDRFSEDLRGQNFLRGLDRETFADQAAGYFNRLNSIHPFREGNGRTQRAFMIALAKNAGHELSFDVVSAERMAQASIAGHERGDVDAFKRMFREISDPERVQSLEKAQTFLTSQGFDWQNRYMATTEPGRRYDGVLVGVGGSDFMMHDKKNIVVGKTKDLPRPLPEQGQHVVFETPRKTRANARGGRGRDDDFGHGLG
ncbi:Fic/DOC family protein [Martelella mediterranea]|uniref:protein adenylyltransferase n=1 Tax=Martelella mediterranea TaxID=293089 RepID=A0A4R3NJ47_9HYPH|nr:Fic family protein [Martelella mediterranea]TCT33043.1 cell filamentation protein [Martelella mediterranea]